MRTFNMDKSILGEKALQIIFEFLEKYMMNRVMLYSFQKAGAK
jgi:hypothetical protein